MSTTPDSKPVVEAKPIVKINLKRSPIKPSNDVIFLDDSSNDAFDRPISPPRKKHRSRSRSKERMLKSDLQRHRSIGSKRYFRDSVFDVKNRPFLSIAGFKDEMRRDNERERDLRYGRNSPKSNKLPNRRETNSPNSRQRSDSNVDRTKLRLSRERERYRDRGDRERGDRERERERDKDRERERDRDRERDREVRNFYE